MSNNKNDITYLQDCWQKLIAIDHDFKDISTPPENADEKLKEFWYKNKFSSAYEWAKYVKSSPFYYGKEVTKKVDKIIEFVNDMEKKGVLQGNNDH